MDIFDFSDFRKFTLKRFDSMPRHGHGQLKKLSEYLGVHTTFVSQVFRGEKALSAEQGIGVAEFLGLSDLETQYFVKLIQIERAGSAKLKKLIQAEAQEIRERSQKIANRLVITQVLPDEHKAVFYSAWYYSAIRLLVGIDGFQDVDAIAVRFKIPKKQVADVLTFLFSTGLLVKHDGVMKVGPSKTHLGADSPFIKLHHTNWRFQALENVNRSDDEKLHYSSPMTVGKKEVDIIRNQILKMIEEIGKVIDPAPNEELMCLNVDWFRIG
jgi:uncharacterized protein (TIGR02147 family)